MPKQRAPLDYARYQELVAQGLSQRQIARELGIPESTLRDNLKLYQAYQEAQAEIPKGNQGIPRNDVGVPQGDQSTPMPDVTVPEKDFQDMLAWWRERQRGGQEKGEELQRMTYHVSPRWIEAIRREADLTRESYAAVVNRAFRQYFEGKGKRET